MRTLKNRLETSVNRRSIVIALLVAVAVFYPLSSLGQAHATPLKYGYLRLDNPVAGATSTSRICLSPSTTNAATPVKTVVVTFPTTTATDYTVSQTSANWTITTTGLDSSPINQIALPNVPATGTVSGKAVTVTLSATATLTSGTLYCFNFSTAAALTIGSACVGGNACEATQGTIVTKDSGGTTLDSTTYSETTVASGTPNANQVSISNATVPPIFNFSLSGNTDAFTGNLSLTSTISTSGRNIVISTNANNGWIIWAQDLNNNGSGRGALKSATTSTYINPAFAVNTGNRTPSNGSEDYGLGITAVGCSGTANTNYDSTVGTKIGTLDPTQFQPIANGPAGASCTTTEVERATISATTKAASDYADTITFVGAGNF